METSVDRLTSSWFRYSRRKARRNRAPAVRSRSPKRIRPVGRSVGPSVVRPAWIHRGSSLENDFSSERGKRRHSENLGRNRDASFTDVGLVVSEDRSFDRSSIHEKSGEMRRVGTGQDETRRDETGRDGFQVSRNSVAVGYDRSNSRPTTGNAISKLISIFYLYAPASSRQFYTSAIFRGVYVRPAASSLVEPYAERTREERSIDRSNRERPITTKRILSIRGTILWPTHRR